MQEKLQLESFALALVVARLQGTSVRDFSTNFFLKGKTSHPEHTKRAVSLSPQAGVFYVGELLLVLSTSMSDVRQKMPKDVFETDFEFWKHCEVTSLRIDR